MNETFSKNLRKLRGEKHMTQEQVAEKLGVSAQSVSRWETGATFPDILLLPELAKLYGVLVDDLFKESPEGYDNYANRLLAVYESTWKHEDFLAAAQEYDKMVKADTMTAKDYRCFGLLHDYMSTVCTRKAFEFYDKSMSLCKDSDSDLYYRVKRQKNMLRTRTGEGQACIDEQRKAIKEALLYGYAGDACRELKKYDEAFAYWEKHLELDSTWLDSLYSMGFCYEEIGDYKKAYEVWTKLSKILTQKGGKRPPFRSLIRSRHHIYRCKKSYHKSGSYDNHRNNIPIHNVSSK